MNFNNSKTLKELRDAIIETREEQDRIYSAAERENRSLTKDEDQRLNELRRKHDQAERDYQDRARELEERAEVQNGTMAQISEELRAARLKRAANDNSLAKIAKYLANGNALPADLESRVIGSSNNVTIQDPVVRDEIIFGLQPNYPLAELGVQFAGFNDNNVVQPKVANGDNPAVQWWEEGDQLTHAAMTISSVKWTFKDVALRVDVYDNVLTDSSGRAEQAITGAMRRAIQDGLLSAVLSGSTDNKQPDGVDNFSGTLSVDADGASADYFHLLDAMRALMDVNVDPARIGMIGNPVTWRQLAGLTDGQGQPLNQPEGVREMMKRWTTAVGKGYGATEDLTRAYLADWSQMVIGFQGPFSFKLDQIAKDYLKTVFIMHMRLDVQPLFADNFLILENLSTTVPVQGN